MNERLWINARDKLGFLAAIMHELSGDYSQIILEGELSQFDFSGIDASEIVDEYRCDPDTSVVSLALTERTAKEILRQIQPHGGFVQRVRHIQIRVNDEIQLLVGDHFDNECISVGQLVPVEFLSRLKAKRIVRAIKTDAEARAKYQ